MNIAILAPVSWPVPPQHYGPWEQVCANLCEELVRLGHEVTLFAAPGSRTSARLVATVPHPFNQWPADQLQRPQQLDPDSGLLVGPPDFRILEQKHIATCMEWVKAGDYDVVHSHLHVHALVFSRLIPCPMVTTLHGSAWVESAHSVLTQYKDMPMVSISDAERQFKPDLNYVATVYNGINLQRYAFEPDKKDFLLFSGRLAPEKGAAEAVDIALQSGMPLKMAGLIEDRHRPYFAERIEPRLDGHNVEYVGLLSQEELVPMYQGARGLLCPTRWAEPFGLVGAEALACGTPLLAARMGALPEIVEVGTTGFLFDDPGQAADLVPALQKLRPADCRASAEKRFAADVMAAGYERVYRSVVGRGK